MIQLPLPSQPARHSNRAVFWIQSVNKTWAQAINIHIVPTDESSTVHAQSYIKGNRRQVAIPAGHVSNSRDGAKWCDWVPWIDGVNIHPRQAHPAPSDTRLARHGR